MIPTWSGSRVPLRLAHRALLGWIRWLCAYLANTLCVLRHRAVHHDGALRCQDCPRAFTLPPDLNQSVGFDQRETWHPDGRFQTRESRRMERDGQLRRWLP